MTKISDYTAGTPPIDPLSEYDVSFWDGAAFVTRSFTHAQLLAIFGNAPTSTDNAISRFDGVLGQLQNSKLAISDDASSSVIISHADSTSKIYFNADGLNDVAIGTGIPYDATPFASISDSDAAMGTGAVNGNVFIYADSNPSTDRVTIALNDGTVDHVYLQTADNRAAPITTLAQNSYGVSLSANAAVFNTGVTNSPVLGGVGVTADTDDTAHVCNLNTKIDAFATATGTIDLDTVGNGISDGAYKTVTATGNITLNATTVYSTNNSAKWTLEFTQDAGGTNTLTLGTNFLTPGGVAIAVSVGANDTDILKFETDSAGKHRLVEHRKAYA